jgi:hypothetical protein
MVAQHPLSAEIQDQIFCALGQAVAKVWSQLPQEIQHNLFEAAVASQGEPMRQQLAVFLHHKHQRTSDAVKTQAMLEPDSRGG